MEKEGRGRERRNKAGWGRDGVGGDGEERGVLHQASLSTKAGEMLLFVEVSGVAGSVRGFGGLLLLAFDTRPPTPAPKISATPNFSLCLGSLVVRVCLLLIPPSTSLIWFSMEPTQSDGHSTGHWRHLQGGAPE